MNACSAQKRRGAAAMKLMLWPVLALCLGTAGSTPSEARYACAVKKTADGFVTLRQGPSARHPEVARMKPQELVGLLHPPDYEKIERKGDWLFARWYPGTRRTATQMPNADEATARAGWVRTNSSIASRSKVGNCVRAKVRRSREIHSRPDQPPEIRLSLAD
jgi:hypothetical protein